jgi:hypothetical protein
VLFAYLHLFPLLNALLTMQSQAAFSFAYPAYRRTTPPTYNMPESPWGLAADEIEANRQKIVPGAIFPHDIVAMDQPHTTVDIDKAITFVKSMIDLALPDSVQGIITGETVGYSLNQAVHLATLQWSPIIDNAQDCLADRVGWESQLIDQFIGERVYVWGSVPQVRNRQGREITYKDGWMGIGPKELDGVHNYEVILEPVSVNNDELQLRNLRQELDMRLMSPADAIRARGRNPVEVERAWLIHELKQDPTIRQNLFQRVFQQLALVDQEAMRALPPDGQPGQTAPVDMSGMPPGAAAGISQGLPTTGFVPPAGSVAPAAPTAPGSSPPAPGDQPMQMPASAPGVPPLPAVPEGRRRLCPNTRRLTRGTSIVREQEFADPPRLRGGVIFNAPAGSIVVRRVYDDGELDMIDKKTGSPAPQARYRQGSTSLYTLREGTVLRCRRLRTPWMAWPKNGAVDHRRGEVLRRCPQGWASSAVQCSGR